MKPMMLAALLVMTATAAGQEAPRKAEIRGKLDAMKVSLDFKSTPIEDAVGYLRDVSGIDFLIDPDVRTRFSEEQLSITFQVRDLTLRSALKLMLGSRELTATYREGVLVIQHKEKASAATTMDMYDVRDLLLKLCDFAGPKVDLVPDKSGSSFDFGVEPSAPPINEDLIVELIKSTTGEKSWDENPATSVQLANGIMIVTQSQRVHGEVRRLLDRLRAFK